MDFNAFILLHLQALPSVPMMIRPTAATLALSAGVPVKLVAHMLGHSKTAITLDTYTHATKDMQEQAAEAIDEVLGGKR